MSAPPPKSVWSRSTRLVSLAAGLAKQELASRMGGRPAGSVEATRQRVLVQVKQAKAIVQSLGQLKGAAMKAGQFLSIELRDVLPPEVIDVLSALQDSGSTVDWAEINTILQSELGPERAALLDVEHTPMASASIGQVHRAIYTPVGGVAIPVAVKIQFRGIADTIASDLALLEQVARAFLAVQLKSVDLSAVFAELRTVLEREADYEQEAESLLRYQAFAHTIPGLRVPDVYREVSTKKVLVMSFEEGLKFESYLKQVPSESAREAVCRQLLDLYFREFFDWGLVQTDANFANFLFRPDRGEIVLLDFGATRSYPKDFRDNYAALLGHVYRGDYAATLASCEELQLIDRRESELSRRHLFQLLSVVTRVFRPEFQPVEFQDQAYVAECAAALKVFYQSLKHSPPPAQLIFLHRKLGGVYSMGRALRTRVDLVPYWERLQAS
jgi:aarF domain-containing kinase